MEQTKPERLSKVAHNSKRNRRDVTTHDDEDYVYPTKKVGKQTSNRRRDRSLIKKGLVDFENLNIDPFVDEDDWYGDEEMIQTNEEITNQAEYEDSLLGEEMDAIDEANAFDRLHDDLMEDYGHDWEDY